MVRVGGGGPGKEFGHAAAMARGKAARQAREDQARNVIDIADTQYFTGSGRT